MIRFPTRDGQASGQANERQMAAKVDTEGFRTVIQNNADGSTTILRTRGGALSYSTTTPSSAPTTILTRLRSFIARVFGTKSAKPFDPYTLEEIKTSPISEFNYSVMGFRTGYNEDTETSFGWMDVLAFLNGYTYVNGKVLGTLSEDLTTIDTPERWLPWVITDTHLPGEEVITDERLYGKNKLVEGQSRLFAVSTDTVRSWSLEPDVLPPTKVVKKLVGAAARSENRAWPVGQQIDSDTNTAVLGQLEFSGDSWDAYTGIWQMSYAKVAMTLTPPYLNVEYNETAIIDINRAVPTYQGTSDDSGNEDIQLPPTVVALIGSGVEWYNVDGVVQTAWPWSSTYQYSMDGRQHTVGTASHYTNSYSGTFDILGLTGTTQAVNTKWFRDHTESHFVKEQYVDLPPSGTQTATVYLSATTTDPGTGVYIWLNQPNDAPHGARGLDNVYTIEQGIPVSGGPVSHSLEEQVGEFDVTLEGVQLIRISFSRYKDVGDHVGEDPNLAEFDGYLTDPDGLIGSGAGLGSLSLLSVYSDYYANTLGVNAGSGSTRQGMLTSRAAEWAATPLYDAPAYSARGPFYTGSRRAVDTDVQTLSWSSKDYILYDKKNEVYVSVEGEFSGTQVRGGVGSGILTVSLKIQTPGGTATKKLFEDTPTFIEMLEEQELTVGGPMLIPSPQLRLMFVPMYREQGTFRGAAYTTLHESTTDEGAPAAYLFNFVLKLNTYSLIADGRTAAELQPNLQFIPCNLIEMLYGFVFSTKYGANQERYPIDYPVTYDRIMRTLFSNTYQISYRDGAFTEWKNALGQPYSLSDTTEIYRT